MKTKQSAALKNQDNEIELAELKETLELMKQLHECLLARLDQIKNDSDEDALKYQDIHCFRSDKT